MIIFKSQFSFEKKRSDYPALATNESVLENKTASGALSTRAADGPSSARNVPTGIKAAFGFSFLLDVLGLPAIAICSASLFTKLVDHDRQGLGQGIQRGVLGVGTILGPLYAGVFVYRPSIVLASCLVMIGVILAFVVVTYRRLLPLKLG